MVHQSNFFSKYLYKSMAHIQPSFLHFYFFRTRQHNTSFLLTSKDELKYTRGSFLNNQNFYPPGQHFPLKNNSKLSPQIFRYIQDRQDFAHILNSLISKPLFQISKITFSKTKIKPHSWGNFTNQSVLLYHKILKSTPRGIHKTSNTTRFSKFFRPLSGGDLHKTWYASTSTQNIDPILGRLHRTLTISTIFPNSTPSHSLNYGSKGI